MGIFKGSKGPSAAEMARTQSEAAEAERKKIAEEQEKMAADEKAKLEASYKEKMSQRQAFSAASLDDTDEKSRRKFLKGV